MAGNLLRVDYSKMSQLANDMISDGDAIKQILDDAWAVITDLQSSWQSESYTELKKMYDSQSQVITDMQKDVKTFAENLQGAVQSTQKQDEGSKVTFTPYTK